MEIFCLLREHVFPFRVDPFRYELDAQISKTKDTLKLFSLVNSAGKSSMIINDQILETFDLSY